MAFNISEMFSQDLHLQVPHFQVTITPPQGLIVANGTDIVQNIPLLCEATQLPGLTLQTTNSRHYGLGGIEKRPVNTIFTDLPLTFLVDAEAGIVDWFVNWMKLITNWNIDTIGRETATGGMSIFSFNYPDQYETTVQIQVFNTNGEPVILYNLYRAYPLTVDNMNVNWDAQNQLLKLPVLLAFRSWDSTTNAIT